MNWKFKIMYGQEFLVFFEIDKNLIQYGFSTKRIKPEEFFKKIKESNFRYFTLHQIHSDRIFRVSHNSLNNYYADGLISDESGIFLLIKTADCLPIFLLDKDEKYFGAIHSGWKGTYKQIAKKAVFKMEKEFGITPESLIAMIGPGIGECCYEIGEELAKKFLNKNASGVKFKNDKFYLNLRELNKNQMIEMGVKEENIYQLDLCTKCNKDLFYSYRREKGTKARMYSFIGIK
ncbi:MAG: peptidoglycan editing factor PgeF [Acidobacteriota bacterium]